MSSKIERGNKVDIKFTYKYTQKHECSKIARILCNSSMDNCGKRLLFITRTILCLQR